MHLTSILRSVVFLLVLQLVHGLVHAQAGPSAAQGAEAGSFERVTGEVTVTTPGGASRLVNRGDSVASGETVNTTNSSEAVIAATDGTRMTLRPQSRLEITEYHFDKSAGTGAFLAKLFKGSLRTITGLIGKAQPRNQRIATTTATIGIRGTDFEVVVVEADSDDMRAGTYDHVFDGATVLQTPTGEELAVPKDKTGLALSNPRPGEARLQLLDSRPAFIRGGGFDAMQLLQTRPPIIIRPLR